MRIPVLAILLLVAVVAAHAPALDGSFVDFDDDAYVTENEHVRSGLTIRGTRWALTTGHAANWHPLTWLSHQLDCELWGLDPRGHHLTSLVLHALSTLTLFGWLANVTGRAGRSACVAALFAVHPLRVESVAWIAERKDLLSGLFGLLSIWAYCVYARRDSVWAYAASVLSLAAGLAAKPMLVTLPFVYLLLDVWPLATARRDGGKRFGRLVLEKLPFVALVAASSAVTFVVQRNWGAVGTSELVPLGARVANAAVSYVRYLLKLFWPTDLAVLYPHPSLPGGQPWSLPIVLGSTLLLVAITWLVARARSRPYLLVGWLWYVGMLIPVIGFVQVGAQAMADRYTYLPSIGLGIAVVWGLGDQLERAERRRFASAAGTAAALVALIALTSVTRGQTRHWRDSVSLYRHAIAVTGGSAILHNNFGAALERVGESDEALAAYRQALTIAPGSAGTHYNLARLLLARGEPELALRHARLAVGIEPERADHQTVLGNVLTAMGHSAAARDAFRRAVELQREDADAHYNLGNSLSSLGLVDQATLAYETALELRPGFPAAHTNLGNLLLGRGRPGEAASHFRAAIAGEPSLAEAHHGLGAALARTGRRREALGAFAEASRLRPDWPAPLIGRAWLLATAPTPEIRDGRTAVELANRAADLTQRRSARALDTLAAALAEAGDYQGAAEQARAAIRLADEAGDATLVARIRERLTLFETSKPFRSGAGD